LEPSLRHFHFCRTALSRFSELVLLQSRFTESVFAVRLEPEKYDNVVPRRGK
jgi:hypothetical protein